ncbi:MAG: M15 family metallopeptidase [Eubacteriales bacterium]|nr:M15 family metallopeptidase [Eubacteriales bacterium]
MPYKRYDLVNKYDRKGRRKSERVWVKVLLLIVLPIVIVAVVALGAFLGFKTADSDRNTATVPTHDEALPVDNEELLRVVNERYTLDADYVPKLSPFGGVAVATCVFDDLDRMISDAAEKGITVTVVEGYVSYDDQAVLHTETYEKIKKEQNCSDIKAESETNKVCPKEGASESQTGLLIKLGTSEDKFMGSAAEDFLEKYSVSYGFVLRYPENAEETTGMTYNPQLYRYVGAENALNMRRFGMTLEEYSTHVSMH